MENYRRISIINFTPVSKYVHGAWQENLKSPITIITPGAEPPSQIAWIFPFLRFLPDLLLPLVENFPLSKYDIHCWPLNIFAIALSNSILQIHFHISHCLQEDYLHIYPKRGFKPKNFFGNDPFNVLTWRLWLSMSQE